MSILLSVLAAAATLTSSFPPQLIGRWEVHPSNCKVDVELRDTDGWVVVKRNKLEFYEAEAQLLSLKTIAPATYQASIKISEDAEYFCETPRLKLATVDHLVFLSGALRGTYMRCKHAK